MIRRLRRMLQAVRHRLCGGDAARRADAALEIAARQREQRTRAVETSRRSNALMNDALRQLYDALRPPQ